MRGGLLAGIGNGAAAGALWGVVFLAPQVLQSFSALQLAAARYLVYGLVALLLLLPRWQKLRKRVDGAAWRALFRLSLLGNIVYYIFVGLAVQWAGVAPASLIVGLLPVAVTLIGGRGRGAVSLRLLAGPLLLCLAGVLLVGYEGLGSSGLGSSESGAGRAQGDVATRVMGFACAVGALLVWSAYAIDNGRWLSRRPDISGYDWSLLTGIATGGLALMLAVPAFWLGADGHSGADWARFWSVIAGVAIFASIIGNGFWNRASRLLPATLMGQMIVFETLFALLYGFLWDMRWPSLLEIAAIVCLTAGVVWCASIHGRAHEAREQEA